MNWQTVILCLASVAVAAMRFALPPHGLNADDVFKDTAHLFVGGLFGAALVATFQSVKAKWLWILAGGLTVTEVVAFFATR